jgi:hypothetical protein
MTQHKWHKEIKEWADGAVIQFKDKTGDNEWIDCVDNIPSWDVRDFVKYRIKTQPKKRISAKELIKQVVDEYNASCDKEPQYLYVYEDSFYDGDTDTRKATRIMNQPIKEWGFIYLGKIKLEIDDDM